jgi:DNA repair photolyase
VLFTITTLDTAVVSRFEPYSPSPERRLAALEQVAKRGLTTGVMLCPYLPGISDDEAHIGEVVRRARDAGAQFVLLGGLTLKGGPQKDRFAEVLGHYYPHLVPRYEQLYSAGYSPSKEYSRRVDRMAREVCRRHGISGLASLSTTSLYAVITFILVGIITATIIQAAGVLP